MGCLFSKSWISRVYKRRKKSTVPDFLDMPDVKKPFSLTTGNNLTAVRDFKMVEIDHRVPLSRIHVFKLLRSWRGIKRVMDDTGVEMFVRLFRSDANLQSLFNKFKHIRTDDELRSNEALEHHATLVMTTLDDAIVHIDNYDYVQQLLRRVAATHTKFPGFTPDVFFAIKEPFLEAVRVTLGDRYTDNIRSVYGITITYILTTMVEGISEALESLASDSQLTVATKPKS